MIVDPQRRSPRTGNVVIGWINEGGGVQLCTFFSKHCIYFVYNCCGYHSDCCMDCIHSHCEIVVDLQMAGIPPVPNALLSTKSQYCTNKRNRAQCNVKNHHRSTNAFQTAGDCPHEMPSPVCWLIDRGRVRRCHRH